MNQEKMLILGANGQLGRALQEQYPNAQKTSSEELDITNEEAVRNYDWYSVETIINAAAYTNVDGAQTPEGRVAAWDTNARAVTLLGNIAISNGLTIVHISSDYVFDGTQDRHTEDEPLSPLSVYGASKAAGDIAASMVPNHYILRTSWVIGEGKNFVRTMLGLGQKGVEPSVVADQVGRPTFTNELARGIDHLLTQKSPYGTYNISNDGDKTSWADLTRAIFEIAGFDLKVTDTSTAEYFASKPEAAPRPLQSTLELSKIQGTGFKSTDWRDGLQKYIQKESR